MKKQIALLFALMTVFMLSAQTFGEIGSGTTSSNLPSYSLWSYAWSSAIYPAASFGGTHTITKLAFNKIDSNTITLNNQKIYVKETTATTFASMNYENPETNGYTLVYSGPIQTQQGWVIIDITDFNYTGNGNLIVHWENRHATAVYNNNWYSTDCTAGVIKCSGSDTSFPATTGFAPYPLAIPNMRFYYSSNNPGTPINPIPANTATAVPLNSPLSFTIGDNTTGYQIWAGTSTANMTQVYQGTSSNPGVYQYTPTTNWLPSTQYFWKVIATNGSGNSTSNVWSFTTASQVTTLPYTQGFEGTFPPTGWTTNLWVQDSSAHSGTACAKISYLHTGAAILLSPIFNLPANPCRLKFWWSDGDWIDAKVVGHDSTYCEISNNGGSSWTVLATLSAADNMTSYQESVINLSAYAGQNVNIRFRDVTDGSINAYGAFLDDILIEQIPTDALITITPSTLAFSPTVIGATLTQTVSISNQGNSPLVITGVTPTGPFTATNPGTIAAGQTVSSTISFVPTASGNATGSITYNIQGAFSGVNTVQLTGSTYPSYNTIYQNFDATTNMPQDWSTIVVAQSTASFAHVYSSSFDAHSGLNFIKMYNGGDDTVNAQLILISPGVNQLSNHQLQYYAKSSWGIPTDTMILGSISNPLDPATFTPLQTINLTDEYQLFTYSFNATNTDKFFAFKHGLGNAQNYAVYIDDISWEADSVVPNPAVAVYPASSASNIRIKYADMHLAQPLTWSNGGGNPTGYKFYFGETPALELINNMDLNNVNEYALDLNLDYNTTYYWKIVPYNLDGNAVNCPVWNFTTLSDPTINVTGTTFLNEGFEQTNVGDYPLGWELENLNNDSAIWSTIGNSSSSINSHTGTKAMHIPFGFLTPHNDWLYTPPLQLHANATYKLDFWYNSVPFPGDPCVEKMDVKWGTLPTASAMSNQLFYNDNITNDTYIHYEQNFTPTADGKYFVGFHAFSDPIQFILLIDDIKVTMVSSPNNDLVNPVDANVLIGSYPNPFSPQTVINYQVKGNEAVAIDIYNAKGQKVRTLVNGINTKGKHEITWNGKDDNNQAVANGIYFCKMQSNGKSSVLKLLKLK